MSMRGHRCQKGRLFPRGLGFCSRDLFNAIEEGDFPEWDMFIQVMTFEEAETWEFNPFDVTKVKCFSITFYNSMVLPALRDSCLFVYCVLGRTKFAISQPSAV
jgi:hypothetical protein